MSHLINIFIDAPLSIEAFVVELASLLGVAFERRSEETETWFHSHPDGIRIDVGQHDFYFPKREEYRFWIRLEGAIDYWVERERRLYEYTGFVLGKLQEQGKYRLLLDDDAKDKPAFFDP